MDTEKKYYFLRVEEIAVILNGETSEMLKAHPRWTAAEVKLSRGMSSTWITAGSDTLMYATEVRRIEL